MRQRLKALLADRRGATAIEYGLIVSLIVIAIMASMILVADNTIGMWTHVTDKVVSAH